LIREKYQAALGKSQFNPNIREVMRVGVVSAKALS